MFYKRTKVGGSSYEYDTEIYWGQIIFSIFGVIIGIVVIGYGMGFFTRWYSRYQSVQDAKNEIAKTNYEREVKVLNASNEAIVNEMKIKQTAQLVQVEKQKAEIRVAEANGIAESQRIINATLTDKYLQHEAISAQLQMAGSPSHTQIYIPTGQNGIPLVKTIDPTE